MFGPRDGAGTSRAMRDGTTPDDGPAEMAAADVRRLFEKLPALQKVVEVAEAAAVDLFPGWRATRPPPGRPRRTINLQRPIVHGPQSGSSQT